MATRETITVDGVQSNCLNISETVGVKGSNKPGDVMLIQAMLQYIAEGLTPQNIGLASKDDLPVASGAFDAATENAIKRYQLKHVLGLLQQTGLPGLIHPASYKGRNIKLTTGGNFRFMTITLLHFDAQLAAPGVDYTKEIPRKTPQLVPWLKG
jgi:hypothetical protein